MAEYSTALAKRGTTKAVYSETPQASGSVQPKTPPLASNTTCRRPFLTLVLAVTGSTGTAGWPGTVTRADTVKIARPSLAPESNCTELLGLSASASEVVIAPAPECSQFHSTLAPAGTGSVMRATTAKLLSAGTSAGSETSSTLNFCLIDTSARALPTTTTCGTPVAGSSRITFATQVRLSLSPPSRLARPA